MGYKIQQFSVLFSLLFISINSFAADTFTYKNERGSILKFQINANQTLTGTFTTAVTSADCQQVIGMKRPIVGLVAKNSITFSANYPECGSVVTFIGNRENTMMDTIAIVAHPSKHMLKEGPGSRMIGHDLFKRIPSHK